MTTTNKLTLEQFLALPETEPASEFAGGEVTQKPMPTQKHARLQAFLGGRLDEFVTAKGLGAAGTEWRCIFGPPGAERALVPDVVYISRERLTDDDFHLGPPDLAVEILSPDQPANHFADKIQFYLRHGVRLIWVLDPVRLTVTVYAPDQETRWLDPGNALDGGDLLPGFSVAVDAIWARIGR